MIARKILEVCLYISATAYLTFSNIQQNALLFRKIKTQQLFYTIQGLFFFLELTSLICPTSSLTAVMEVHVPEQPVVALHGMDATLNCSFTHASPFNLSDLSVFWQLTDTQRSVHGYAEGRDKLVDQAERFANRTSLFPTQLGLGNASLLLSRVVVADEGSYTCFVRVQDYGSAALLLQVAGESSCDVHDTCKNR